MLSQCNAHPEDQGLYSQIKVSFTWKVLIQIRWLHISYAYAYIKYEANNKQQPEYSNNDGKSGVWLSLYTRRPYKVENKECTWTAIVEWHNLINAGSF